MSRKPLRPKLKVIAVQDGQYFWSARFRAMGDAQRWAARQLPIGAQEVQIEHAGRLIAVIRPRKATR